MRQGELAAAMIVALTALGATGCCTDDYWRERRAEWQQQWAAQRRAQCEADQFCTGINGRPFDASRAMISTGAGGWNGAPPPVKLMVFGGRNHTTYLGCLSCVEYATDSVRNQLGDDFGNQPSQTSIFNRYNEYGSRLSMYSACNQSASDPPVVVDQRGNFYGRLTVNEANPARVRDPGILEWLTTTCAR
jgi:hypothetical protein